MNAIRPNRKLLLWSALAIAAIALILIGWWVLRPAPPAPAGAPIAEAVAPAASERTPLYWYDPMKPEVRFDKPGRSPFMDMDLVPKYSDAREGGVVTIDARMVQSLGVRTAKVERGTLWRRLDAVGTVAVDERRLFTVESRSNGWLERLAVRALGDPVTRGMALAGIYAPDLLAAQEELLLAARDGDAELIRAARSRLSLLGMPVAEVDQVLRSKQARRQVTLVAPSSGVVVELNAREGMQVAPGTALFRIADLSKVWVLVEVPEAQAQWVGAERPVEATLAAFPGETFEGTVEYVYPELQAATRTVRARLAFDNPGLRMKPGMFAALTVFGGPKRDALLVPSEAVIRTGTRSVVILAEGEGRFRPAEVVIGDERDGASEIISGLAEGETIVVSGQFLIDSEANLRSVLARISPP